MRIAAATGVLISLLFATASIAQESVTANIGQGRTAKVTFSVPPEQGVTVEIELPNKGASDVLPLGGEKLMPIAGANDPGFMVRDLDRDGIDEVILRPATAQRSALVILRYDPTADVFVPVEFTDDRDRTNKFMIADASLPVRISPSGEIEAEFETTRQDGRKSHHVAKYKWDGRSYTQSTSN